MVEKLRNIFISSIYEDFEIIHNKGTLYIYPSSEIICKYIKSEERMIIFDLAGAKWYLKYDKISGLLQLRNHKKITIQNHIFNTLAKNTWVGVNGNFPTNSEAEKYMYQKLTHLYTRDNF